jgi:phenylpropionate dioxygenase-like ring-hydroxylating dioxygenase large terminal subunit
MLRTWATEMGASMFLRNAWYVAARSREVERTLLARTILNEPIVLYRKRDGAAVALEDRCCHRHLPLSMGTIIDDDLRCGYHGLRFDANGVCVNIPGQSEIPTQARVSAYPLVERWQWLWIWMGDPARADPALIPNLWWADHPDWIFSQYDMVPLKCNYRLIADNVLDATHLTYVHSSSIGTSSIADIEPKIERDGDIVRVTRWILDRPPPSMYKQAGGFPENVDRWAVAQFQPPCYSINFAGCVDVGCGGPQSDRSKSSRTVELVALSMPTPSTEKTSYYFFAFSRCFGRDDPAVEKMFSEGMLNVFCEDFAVLEAQQHMMDLKPDAAQISLRSDAGPIRARHMLDRIIADEQRAS